MEKWARINYQPCLPLGDNRSMITGCQRHIQLSREAACEGAVLLKNNNGVLPLKKGARVAIFGKAQIDYIKGGGGSGDVCCEYVRDIYEGLKLKDNIDVFDSLSLYYKDYVEKAYKDGKEKGRFDEAEVPHKLMEEAKAFADVAIITINRFSGEGWDRKNDGEDTYFELSQREKDMVKAVCDNFENVVVLLNTGAMIETSWFANNDKITAALMIWQGGMEGGLAAADILVGEVCPSGRLVDTCAAAFEDYPSSAGFHESDDYVKYTEDIFVGYRYFETIPGKKEKVVYPFGYGLSYTDFRIERVDANVSGEKIILTAKITNTGNCSGKEVVQVYYEAPKGVITKASRELCAFAKTKELMPGGSETVIMEFDINNMASYDDQGLIRKSAYIMEQGEYRFYVGKNVRDAAEIDFKFTLNENTICEQLTEYCPPRRLGKRLLASGDYIDVPDREHTPKEFPCDYVCKKAIPTGEKKKLIDVVEGRVDLDEFLSQLTDEEILKLTVGAPNRGVANTCGMGGNTAYGIPAPMTTDGPAGVRIFSYDTISLNTTAFPIATMLACTWNTDILYKVGVAGALECKENNLFMWLTPALNIHRSPLCGRNFEYYSEDPLVSGKMAAAMVKGIQSQNIVATPKHFACNNKETNREESDSIVSERALREIYLKGFEICIKEAKPKLLMTGYNVLNGIHTSENAELLTGILRGEWGYEGVITTDWDNTANRYQEVKAGNDIRMSYIKHWTDKRPFLDTYTNENTRDELAICAKRLMNLIMWLE